MGLWCRHRSQTSPRRDESGEYCRCLDCGARIPCIWIDPPLVPLSGRRHSLPDKTAPLFSQLDQTRSLLR